MTFDLESLRASWRCLMDHPYWQTLQDGYLKTTSGVEIPLYMLVCPTCWTSIEYHRHFKIHLLKASK